MTFTIGTGDLDLTSVREHGHTVVTVRGEVDVYTAPALREQLLTLIRTGHHDLVLDLDEVEFLDSTGLGVLVGALKRVRNHDGSLHLVCAQDRILKVFRITGLTRVFAIHPELSTAVGRPGRQTRPPITPAAGGPTAEATTRDITEEGNR